MKILNSTPGYINKMYSNKTDKNIKTQKNDDVDANKNIDRINFSDRTKNLQKMSKAMETDPADRKKYVSDIKQKFETNQYTINAETIAEKMAGSLLNELS
ncbi:flagellar biosynthesis anti-sigma factor FlgM [Desulfobacula phenolica]|uniref:Anti-sigma-28 factor, FlgM family n=1 Tax=Desulfobacula phenolica TaxID=90732 RepID=A0A1H2DLN9_9BACT|nr:flagellar biosynthesis anti-sigma factor FlgM [Desulfobacula phenolica]SDT83830.1 anti-sigma-28 factor, FlgM family [Desulfobacula phenolica]